MLLVILIMKNLLERFTKKMQKQIKNGSVKWKRYNYSFNSWIDKKDIVT